MNGPRLRALVLTAGFGTRLEPLSLFLPKALLPICGEAVAGHALKQLAAAGCESAVLNLHHMGEEIEAHFGEEWHGLPISYSPESEIQGTWGALYGPREHLAGADAILLVNGDTLCRWPFESLIKQHFRSGAAVTMLLLRRTAEESLGGPVGVDAGGAVVQLRDSDAVGEVAKRHVFAGAHVLSPSLLDRVEEGFGEIINDLYIPLLAEGERIQGVVTGRRWHDLGTPERYLDGCLDWARSHGRVVAVRPRNAISPSAVIDESAIVRRSVIEEGAAVEGGAQVERSVLLAGAKVAGGSSVKRSIIGPGVELPVGADIERRMVTRVRSGYQAGERDSVMGELVYTRLEWG